MSRRSLVVFTLVACLLGGPQFAHADTVSNAERRVQQVLDALYALQDQMNKLDIGFANAQDKATLIAGFKSGVYNFASLPAVQSKAAQDAGLNVFAIPSLSTAANISININS